jgi:hypothetical protein
MPEHPIYNIPGREKERWRKLKVEGVKNIYKISSYGRIKNNKGKLMSPFYDKDGYMKYSLTTISGSKKKLLAHRLVALHFIPNPENKPEINHIRVFFDPSSNKWICPHDDNYYENLEWCTRTENIAHSKKNHLEIPVIGENHGYSVFTDKEVDYICSLIEKGYNNKDIYAKCKVNTDNLKEKERYRALIKALIQGPLRKQGEIWKHIRSKHNLPSKEERRKLINKRYKK